METHAIHTLTQAQGRSSSRTRRAHPLRVVIIEDSERILAHLAEELSAIDNLCIAGTAATEEEARRLLAQGHWDLAILDLQLREGNGLRVIKAVREEMHCPGTVAVFTNYAFPQYRKRSLELGADYFFDKSRELARVLALAEDLAAS